MKFLLTSMTIFASLAITLETGLKQSPVEELTDDTFENYLNVSHVAMVDFFAPWCPHCKKFAPTFDEVAIRAQGSRLNVFFAKVNCAGGGENICKKVHVRFLPTIRVYRDGKSLGDYTDDRTTEAILAFAQKASSAPNDLKMTMADDISDPHKIPSNVTPWQADEAAHH